MNYELTANLNGLMICLGSAPAETDTVLVTPQGNHITVHAQGRLNPAAIDHVNRLADLLATGSLLLPPVSAGEV